MKLRSNSKVKKREGHTTGLVLQRGGSAGCSSPNHLWEGRIWGSKHGTDEEEKKRVTCRQARPRRCAAATFAATWAWQRGDMGPLRPMQRPMHYQTRLADHR